MRRARWRKTDLFELEQGSIIAPLYFSLRVRPETLSMIDAARPAAAHSSDFGRNYRVQHLLHLRDTCSASARRSRATALTGFAMEDASEGNVMSPIGKKAILVVEDEALVRLATRDGIEAVGFQVHDAHNADEAIQSLEANPDIGLIFTDVDMPGSMDGVKLAHYVRKRWPPVKIIVTSGFKNVTPDQLPNGSIFLSKPYLPEQLRQKIEFLFDSSSA
jgi:two-component system, response regulator PdtaR